VLHPLTAFLRVLDNSGVERDNVEISLDAIEITKFGQVVLSDETAVSCVIVVLFYLCKFGLQCFDAVGWTAGNASGL